MIASALFMVSVMAAEPSLEAAKEQTRKILAHDNYGFCHDPKYPLTDTEAGWCPPVGPDKNSRCPAYPSACNAPRAILQDLGRLNFSRGGEGKSDVGTDQDAAKEDPSKEDKPGETKSGKRKQPKRETLEDDPETEMPELGGLGYVLFWVILGAGLLFLIVIIVRNSSSHKPEDEAPAEPLEADPAALPAAPGPGEQLVRDVSALLDQARAAASAGDYNRAIQRAHAALLHRLDHDGLIRVAPFRTNGDYLRDLGPQPDLRGSVRQIVRDVEQVQFGTTPADASLYERVIQRIVPIATRRGDTLLMLLAACSLYSCDGGGKSYPFDRSPSGANAVIELGAVYGLDITFRTTSLAAIDRAESLGDDDHGRTMVLLHDAPDPGASEWDRLLDWADNGHHLVLAGLPPPSELNLYIETGATTHTLALTDDSDLGDLDLLTPDDARLVRKDDLGRPLLRFTDDSMYAIQYDRGYRSGDVTVFADDRLFTNGGLMLRDNPEFLVRFLKDLGASEVELVDGLLDLGADTPAETILNTNLTPVILQILALLAILFFWRGVRFGRPHDPPSRSRRHFSEHIEALGTHYARARASRHAARIYAGWALERLREKTQSTRTPGLYPVAQAIAGRTGDDENRVMETLVEASSLQGDGGDPRIAYSRRALASANTDDLKLMQDLARLVRLVGGPR